MPKLHELSHKDDYLSLRQVHKKDIRLLWHSAFYDGPINGLLLYKGTKHWFQMCGDSVIGEEEDAYLARRYLIIELAPNQLQEKEYWHNLFREKVGTDTDYDKMGKRPIGTVKSKELWNEYYEASTKREKEDFSNNEVIGWFEDN